MRKATLLIFFATLGVLVATALPLSMFKQTSAAAPAGTFYYTFVSALLIDDMDPSDGVIEPASFQLLSFSWGEENEGPSGSITEPKMLMVTKKVDEYSADLFQACADQRVWSTVILNVSTGDGAQKSEILNLEMYDVEVRGYDIQQVGESDSPVELLTLYFDSIEYTTIWYNLGGSMAGDDTETWDFGTGNPL
jgi:type VI protein secretion system component Hcp